MAICQVVVCCCVGCVWWWWAAVRDALRLSEGMTYKNALAGIPFGGGKSVILADDHAQPTREQLALFGRWLNELEGRYITAEDVGMGVEQAQTLAQFTPHVSGLGQQGIEGDPSPKTAYGVFRGLLSAVRFKLGVERLNGVTVAVQGLGAMGWALCRHLHDAGAQLVVADINQPRVDAAVQRFAARAVSVERIASLQVDVFAPCALGGVITEHLAHRLNVSVVAGAANNQLACDAAGEVLARRGIVYAPDFVINAGGVISVAHEHLMQTGYFAQAGAHAVDRWASGRIEDIAPRLNHILQQARNEGRSTDAVAKEMALKVIAAG